MTPTEIYAERISEAKNKWYREGGRGPDHEAACEDIWKKAFDAGFDRGVEMSKAVLNVIAEMDA
jgi:hypothetical protein